MNFLQISSKSDLVIPSYDQKEKKNITTRKATTISMWAQCITASKSNKEIVNKKCKSLFMLEFVWTSFFVILVLACWLCAPSDLSPLFDFSFGVLQHHQISLLPGIRCFNSYWPAIINNWCDIQIHNTSSALSHWTLSIAGSSKTTGAGKTLVRCYVR